MSLIETGREITIATTYVMLPAPQKKIVRMISTTIIIMENISKFGNDQHGIVAIKNYGCDSKLRRQTLRVVIPIPCHMLSCSNIRPELQRIESETDLPLYPSYRSFLISKCWKKLIHSVAAWNDMILSQTLNLKE